MSDYPSKSFCECPTRLFRKTSCTIWLPIEHISCIHTETNNSNNSNNNNTTTSSNNNSNNNINNNNNNDEV